MGKAPKIDDKKFAAHMARNKKSKPQSSTKKSLADIRSRAEGKTLSKKQITRALGSKKAQAKPKDQVSLKKAPWEKQNESFDFRVNIDGFPEIFMSGNSPGEVKAHLRGIVKQPSMVKSVDRVTAHDKKKHFRKKSMSEGTMGDAPEWGTPESTKRAAEMTPGQSIDENMSRVAKELEAYARKNGGIDKMDFMKAAMMMKKGQTSQLKKFVDDLDTEPREKILSLMQKDADRRKEYKAYQKSMRKEEVSLDESSPASMIRTLSKEYDSALRNRKNYAAERMAVLKKMKSFLDKQGMDRKKQMAAMKTLDASLIRIANKYDKGANEGFMDGVKSFFSKVGSKIMGDKPTGNQARVNTNRNSTSGSQNAKGSIAQRINFGGKYK